MIKKNLQYPIILVLLLLAIIAVWVFWPQPKENPNKTGEQGANLIPKLNEQLPATGVIESFDKTTGELVFIAAGRSVSGRLVGKTEIIRQVKDKKGALSLESGSPSDLAKGKSILVSPAPSIGKTVDLNAVQIVK